MNKHFIIIGLSVILLFISLSGCIDEDKLTSGKPVINKDTILDKVELNGLILNGTEHRIYDRKELIIRGNIIVEDDSKLNISNSKIIIDQEYNKQYSLSVKDNATFIVDNVYFESINWRWFNFEYFDDAKIKIVDFENEQEPWQTVEGNVHAEFFRAPTGITIFAKEEPDAPFTGSIIINESKQVYFEIDLKPSVDYVFEFPNGFVKEWHPDYFEGSIEVYNSIITNLDIDIWPGVNVTVINSNPLELGWIFGDGWGQKHSIGNSAEIIGLKNMTYDDFVFKANNATLRLINTTVTGWWPIVTGEFELTLRDCHMIDPWAYGESKFIAYDSFIFYMSATNEAYVEIHDSVVEDSLVALENSTIKLFNTEFFSDTVSDEGAEIIIDGNIID